METSSFLEYLDKHGTFNTMGYDLDDPKLERICKKALEEDRQITDDELYSDTGDGVFY